MIKRLAVLIAVGLCAWSGEAFAGVTNTDLEVNFGFRVVLQYAHSDIAASDGTTNIPIAGTRDTSAGDQANVEYVMPFSGRIIGISAASNAELTAGLAHLQISVNGVNVTGATEIANNDSVRASLGSVTGTSVVLKANEGTSTASTTAQRAYSSFVDRFKKSSPYTFSAGDRIGVSMTTVAAGVGSRPSPTTADF